MRDSLSLSIVVVCAAGLVIVAAAGVTPAASAPDSSVTLSQAPGDPPADSITGEPGETVTLTVWTTASDVRGYQTNLTYDPAVLQIQDVAGTSDFEDPVSTVNDEQGWVAFNQYRPAATDDPVLATITFEFTENADTEGEVAFIAADTKFADGDGSTVSPATYRSPSAVQIVEDSTGTPTQTATPTPTETSTSTPNSTATATSTPNSTATATSTPNSTTTATSTPTPDSSDGDDGGDDNDDSSGGGSSGGGGGSSSSDSSRADITFVNASVSTASVAPNASVDVVSTLENRGRATGSTSLELLVNGSRTADGPTVTLDPGETEHVTMTVSLVQSGSYELSVGDALGTKRAVAGLVVVERSQMTPTASSGPRSTTPRVTTEPTPAIEATDAAGDGGGGPNADGSDRTGAPTGGSDAFGDGFGAVPGLLAVLLAASSLLLLTRARRG